MKYLIFLLAIIVYGCTKTDTGINGPDINNSSKEHKNTCEVISVNADKQNTNDFYMIKTLGQNGLPSHIKTQILNIGATPYVFDYNITYAPFKALFKGTTKEINWVLDNPEDYQDSPEHFESERVIDDRDVEILFDNKTGFAKEVRFADNKEPILNLTYDKHKFLSLITIFFKTDDQLSSIVYEATTDKKGNILSLKREFREGDMYFGWTGILYSYASEKSDPKQSKLFYESPNDYINSWYSILELLNWGPFQPNNERTSVTVQWMLDDPHAPFWGSTSYSASYINTQYDQDKKLISYTFDGQIERDYFFPFGGRQRIKSRTIQWNCP